MSYSFLTPTNIFRRYREAKDYTDKLTQPFPEFVRIAKNKPVENLGNYPKVTDGTSAGIIRKTPRMAVQQLPTGLVESDNDNDWLPIIAQFKYDNEILPNANQDYGLFEKSHLVIENGGAVGSTATFNRFAKYNKGFSPDPEIIYWGDLSIQKGKKSGPACDYVFYRTWWQKSDIEALIDSENQLAAQAKKRGEEYEATWDTVALKAVLEAKTSKDQQATTPTEQDRGLDADGIELITGFQKGFKAKFYTFNPQTKKIVRAKVNKDPRGCMPIDWFYFDIEGTNPLGRGIPEMVGGLQNLIDSRMQMATYVQTYATNPATIQLGDADSDFEYLPNKLIKTNDPNFKVTPVDINTSALNQYVETQQYLQSQLYQLIASPHSNISSDNAVANDGKTPTALNQQQNVIDIDINTIRKHFETWWESWSEGSINLYFAERSGKELLQLNEETAEKLRKLTPTEEFDPRTAINEHNQIIIDYDTATPALKFRVDASSSKMQDNANQIKALQLIQQFVENAPQIAQILPPAKWAAIYNTVVSLAGVENPEDIRLTDEEEKQIEEAVNAAQQPQEAPQTPPRAPSETITFKDAAAVAPRAAAAMLEQAGLPSEDMKIQALVKDQQVSSAVQPQAPTQIPQSTPTQQPDEITPQHIQELQSQGIPDEDIARAVQIYQQQRGAINV